MPEYTISVRKYDGSNSFEAQIAALELHDRIVVLYEDKESRDGIKINYEADGSIVFWSDSDLVVPLL